MIDKEKAEALIAEYRAVLAQLCAPERAGLVFNDTQSRYLCAYCGELDGLHDEKCPIERARALTEEWPYHIYRDGDNE